MKRTYSESNSSPQSGDDTYEDVTAFNVPTSLSIPKKKQRTESPQHHQNYYQPQQHTGALTPPPNDYPTSSSSSNNIEHIHDLLRQRYFLPNKLINIASLSSHVKSNTNHNIQFAIAQNLLKKVFPFSSVSNTISIDHVLSTPSYQMNRLQSIRHKLNETLSKMDNYDPHYVCIVCVCVYIVFLIY
jgi:hypothetical protein